MVFEIGVNLRVTECLDKGERLYMEDFSKCYFERLNYKILFGFFGIFDGHGGSEAAIFTKKTLINEIKKNNLFWSQNDDDVMTAIKQGFLNTHELMWAERDKWLKTVSGFHSTAGTTATIAIVRNRKLYIGHVGDSACVLGYSSVLSTRTDLWEPQSLTVEHKPTNMKERKRIRKCGGSMVNKSGVERVVWKRPIINSVNQHTVEGDSIKYEEIPFLAVTRSLGDLWSYDEEHNAYHISPEPDLKCISLDSMEHRCLIIGSDGLWNVVSTKAAIEIVRICERETERRVFLDPNINSNFFYNPAASLVKYAISQWKRRHVRADNISALVVMIDPPGPSMTKLRDDRRNENFIALDLENSVVNKLTTNEDFTKSLGKKFLIECSRWRSANEHSEDYGLSNKASFNYNDSNLTFYKKKSSEKATSDNLKESFSHNKSISIGYNKCQRAISSHSVYSKYCKTWINNLKIWDFLSCYFNEKSLKTELDIIRFLDRVNSYLLSEILKIMPWIYGTKKRFKNNDQLHGSLKAIPIFCEFWLDLYINFIKPLEKLSNNQRDFSANTTLFILQSNVLNLLKQYNYLKDQRNLEEKVDNYQVHNNINENQHERQLSCKTIDNLTKQDKKNQKNVNPFVPCDPTCNDLKKPKTYSKIMAIGHLFKKHNSFSLENNENVTSFPLVCQTKVNNNSHFLTSSRLSGGNFFYRSRRGKSFLNGLTNCMLSCSDISGQRKFATLTHKVQQMNRCNSASECSLRLVEEVER